MAIEKNIEIDYGTSYGKYHRISKIEIDYDRMDINAYVRHYASLSYREEEKAEFDEIKSNISRIKELEAKKELTEDEQEEQMKLISSQVQEAKTIQNRSLNVPDTKYTFKFNLDEEINRDSVYEKIMNADEYKRAKEA